jgi:methyl-accepting chemotaxis protein
MSESEQSPSVGDENGGLDTDDPRPARPFRRKRWIVDWAFQTRYTLALFLVSSLVGVACAFVSAYFFLFIVGEGADPESLLSQRLPVLAMNFVVIALLVVPMASILLSHRVAGPIYRLRKDMERVGRGDLDFRVHLRGGDYLKSTAATFNHMVESLEQGEGRREQSREAARQAIRAALGKLESADSAEFPEALRLLEEAEEQLQNAGR